ncbi:MAG: response regulator transcription factor [Novosphingobium sp.]|nr:response regulator transcription factor [Novosphingobium sp.]
MRANVAIVEDDPLVAAHVGQSVAEQDGLSLAGTAATLAEARALLDRDVDLFILDLGLPDGNGIDLIETIRARGRTDTKILVLSNLGDQATVLAAVLAGADGYLLKDLTSFNIGQQVSAALAGEAPLSPSIAAYVLRYLREQQDQARTEEDAPDLTPREFELLQLLARGHSNREAAEAMSVSRYTVADHAKAIYRKLGVSSRGEALVRAFRSGLLRP